jgi:hypothetical protein
MGNRNQGAALCWRIYSVQGGRSHPDQILRAALYGTWSIRPIAATFGARLWTYAF